MTSERRRFATLSLVAALLFAPLAHAGSKDTAKTHFVQGLAAVERGDLVLAIGQFLASYEAYAHPTTAFNIAKAYEDKGDVSRALTWYQRFQQIAPHRANEAAEAVLRLRERLDPVAAVPKAPQPDPEPASTDEKPSMADVLKRIDR